MKTRKKRYTSIIIILVILLILGIIGFIYLNKDEEKSVIKVERTIPGYEYTLEENETKLYKSAFKKLESILDEEEIDKEEYAKCISELFIIDFYTLDNKLSKNDIGGVQFVYPSIKDNFVEKARSTFYKYLEVKEGRTQSLPVVSEITSVLAEKTLFKVKDTKENKEAYKVSISWEYEEDLDYEKEADLYVVEESNKLYIVEMD